jgi:hypothetical protein
MPRTGTQAIPSFVSWRDMREMILDGVANRHVERPAHSRT